MRLLVLAALLTAARALHAQEAHWTPLDSPEGAPRIQADLASAQISADDVVVVWVRVDAASDPASEVFDDDGTRQTVQYDKAVARFSIDCRHRQYSFLQATSYDAHGSVVQSYAPDTTLLSSQSRHEPAPKSLADNVVRGVCNREAPGLVPPSALPRPAR
jgi:hypothetical protein